MKNAVQITDLNLNDFTSSFFYIFQVVIDRGPSPYLSNIDLYLDGKLITSVQARHLFG